MVTRQKKEETVELIKAKSNGAQMALVADFTGMSMQDLINLKSQMREHAQAMVVKNTLAKIAFKGGSFEGLDSFLVQPSMVFFTKGETPAPAIKSFRAVQKKMDSKLVLKGGLLAGTSEALSKDEVFAIGDLPPREQIFAQIAGMLTSTPSSIVQAINQTISELAEVIVKVAEKNNK